jgi:hypothetical protein
MRENSVFLFFWPQKMNDAAHVDEAIVALDKALKDKPANGGQALCIVVSHGVSGQEKQKLLAHLYAHSIKQKLAIRVALPTAKAVEEFFDKTVPAITQTHNIFGAVDNEMLDINKTELFLLGKCDTEHVEAAQRNKATLVVFLADETPDSLAHLGKLKRRFLRF